MLHVSKRIMKTQFPSLIGSKILCGIYATDKDKLNTTNSEIYYTIVDGNRDKKFSLGYDDHHGTCIILSKSVDYDEGEHIFNITIAAMVSFESPF